MSFLIILATAFTVGLLAQKVKHRTGALWGFIRFGLILPPWWVVYSSTFAVQPTLYREPMA